MKQKERIANLGELSVLGQFSGERSGANDPFPVAKQVCEAKILGAPLSSSGDFTGTSVFEIGLRDGETIVGGGENLEPSQRMFRRTVTGDENAPGLPTPATHPPPKLVELGQAEPIRGFDDHDRSGWDIDTDLDDRGGQDDLDPSLTKTIRDSFALVTTEPAVEDPDLDAAHRPANKGLVFLQGGGLELLRGLDQGVDDKSLAARLDLRTKKPENALPCPAVPDLGADRGPTRRKLIDERKIEVAVEREGQRPRDRGRGHDEKVGRIALVEQPLPLSDAEPVLFVDDDQTEVAIGDTLLEQSVCSHDDIDLTLRQFRPA